MYSHGVAAPPHSGGNRVHEIRHHAWGIRVELKERGEVVGPNRINHLCDMFALTLRQRPQKTSQHQHCESGGWSCEDLISQPVVSTKPDVQPDTWATGSTAEGRDGHLERMPDEAVLQPAVAALRQSAQLLAQLLCGVRQRVKQPICRKLCGVRHHGLPIERQLRVKLLENALALVELRHVTHLQRCTVEDHIVRLGTSRTCRGGQGAWAGCVMRMMRVLPAMSGLRMIYIAMTMSAE